MPISDDSEGGTVLFRKYLLVFHWGNKVAEVALRSWGDYCYPAFFIGTYVY